MRVDPRSAPVSPLNLFQERYRHDGWRLLCCTVCLNLCTGRALADRRDLEALLSPLGLQRRRALSLTRMSLAYACLWDGRDARDLPGIGKYGADSYDIFIRGRLDVLPEDKELRKFMAWMTTRG